MLKKYFVLSCFFSLNSVQEFPLNDPKMFFILLEIMGEVRSRNVAGQT